MRSPLALGGYPVTMAIDMHTHPSLHEAILQSLEGDRVRCSLCLHRCLIKEGGLGVCGVRGVVDGTLRALTYGRVSSIAIDPIEKKPVFHYAPGTQVLSLGSVGCTMRCGHCQNWQISRPKADDGQIDLENVPPEAVTELARRYNTPGVAFTYNEPVIWVEYILDCGRLLQAEERFVIMVTNGYVTFEGLDAYAEVVDVWRVDIKGYYDETVRRLCKVRGAAGIRDAAVRAKRVHGMHVECVTNVVPTVNDSDEELHAIAHWMATELGPDTPWHVTRFVPYLEFADLPPTPIETLMRARDIGSEEGLNFIYLGNVDVPGGEDTVCPQCNVKAINRRGFSAKVENLDGGKCASCGAPLNIYFPGEGKQARGSEVGGTSGE